MVHQHPVAGLHGGHLLAHFDHMTNAAIPQGLGKLAAGVGHGHDVGPLRAAGDNGVFHADRHEVAGDRLDLTGQQLCGFGRGKNNDFRFHRASLLFQMYAV